MVRRWAWLSCVAAVGCQGVLGLSDDSIIAVSAPADGGAGDDGGAGQYHDLSSASNWSSFDMTPLTGATTFFGGTFDGRYVYLAPSTLSLVARYDTMGDFGPTSSWSTFELTRLAAPAGGATGGGAAFDGRYVYVISGSRVSRYDSSSSFGAAGSWETFDVSTVFSTEGGTPPPTSFIGSSFDGRFLYLAPSQGPVIVRFDTTQFFASPASWETFDATSLGASAASSAGAYQGSVFDGRYVYFVPGGTLPVLRYNTDINFADRAAWSAFQTNGLESGANTFRGGAYDGRYLYLVPSGSSLAVQYDITVSFSSSQSWSVFDTTTVSANAAGFGGSAFDGRYLYLVPTSTTFIARCDTTATFTDSTAWEVFDTKSVSGSQGSFAGAVFDGRYVYLVPSKGSGVVRFDARTAPSIPNLAELSGSFL